MTKTRQKVNENFLIKKIVQFVKLLRRLLPYVFMTWPLQGLRKTLL